MRSLFVKRSTEGAVEYVLYDCSLEMDDRRKHKMRFESGRACAAYLGIPDYMLYHYAKMKRRFWSPRMQNWYAARKSS